MAHEIRLTSLLGFSWNQLDIYESAGKSNFASRECLMCSQIDHRLSSQWIIAEMRTRFDRSEVHVIWKLG